MATWIVASVTWVDDLIVLRERGRPWRDGPRTGGSASDALADIGCSSPFVFVLRSAEFLGESDEKPFRPADVAEPIRVFILDDFANQLCAARAEPLDRVVDAEVCRRHRRKPGHRPSRG